MAMAVAYVDQGTNAMYCLEQLLIGPSELDRIIGALAKRINREREKEEERDIF